MSEAASKSAGTATLVSGGPILTMSATPHAEALAMRQGRIIAVGSLQECRNALGTGYEELDLAGRCLLPGFVDPHCHPVMLGQMRTWVDCAPERVSSIEEMVEVLKRAAAALPSGAPLRGYGYEHRRLAEMRHLSSADLDKVSTDRPVMVMNASGHGAAVNTFAMKALGITRDTLDPAGGEIVRDPAGNPTGLFWDGACDLLTGEGGIKVGNHGPNFHFSESEAAMDAIVQIAQDEFLRAGITSVADMQVSRREVQAYLRARESGALEMRVGMYVLSSHLESLLDLGISSQLGDDGLRFLGVKLYADGTLGGWTAYFPEGYAADPCMHGQLYHDATEYAELVRKATAVGMQTATHAQSPEAIRMVLEALAASGSVEAVRRGRHRIEHCGLPLDDQIDRMGELDVIPVPQPQHHLRFGDGTVEAVGELGTRYNPYGLFAKAGVRIVLSSDAPVAPPNPLEAVAAAHMRRTASGRVLGDASLRIGVREALAGYTIGAAYAIGRESAVGSLEVGKLADLAIVEENPTEVDPERLATLRVSETWVGGRRVR